MGYRPAMEQISANCEGVVGAKSDALGNEMFSEQVVPRMCGERNSDLHTGLKLGR